MVVRDEGKLRGVEEAAGDWQFALLRNWEVRAAIQGLGAAKTWVESGRI